MSKDLVRFLVFGDLHGEIPKIHVDLSNIDAFILPGDICGDDIRKYVIKYMKATEKFVEGKIKKEPKFADFCSKKKLKELEKLSFEKGRKVLKYLSSFKKPIFLVPGNWDNTQIRDGVLQEDESWSKLIKDFPYVVDVEHKITTFKGISFVGHGSTSAPEPLIISNLENFCSEEELEEYLQRHYFFTDLFNFLEQLFIQIKDEPILFISHNAPYNSKLDIIKNKNLSSFNNKHYGSVISEKLIKKYSPMLCVCGHIHEGYGKDNIGKTLCVNSGFGGDLNTIIEIDIKKKKILNIEFIGKNKVE